MAERVEFPGSGQRTLVGRLDLPSGRPGSYAVFAHCFTCGKDSLAASRVSRALTEQGFAVLRFDVPGLGESPGDFADSSFSCDVLDLIAAADFLRSRDRGPALLVGHSLGGAAVLAAANRIPEVRAVATIGAPSDPAHVSHLLTDALPALEADGEAEVQLAGRPFRLRRAFLDDIREQPQLERIARLGRALLVMHSPQDAIVGIENARTIYQAARHPKSFVSLDGADHLLTRPADSRYVAGVLAAWASRYVEAPEASNPDPGVPGQVVVRESGQGRYRQHVTAGRHRWTVDEPVSAGGDDDGPAPYDLLLAALGSCTAITMRMYADRKGWPLTSVQVTLVHDRIHATDCAECVTSTGRLDRIRRQVLLSGELNADQIAALATIADKCPVHRTLTHEVTVRTDVELARVLT